MSDDISTAGGATLRATVITGGAYLLVRQGLGIIVSAVGLLVVVKMIGPKEYGVFAAASALCLYLQGIATLGADVFLLRALDIDRDDFDVTATLLLIMGVAGAAVAIVALPLLGRWISFEGFSVIAAILFATLPIGVLATIPRCILERDLNYKAVGTIEFVMLLVLHGTAIAGAWMGLGAWALVWASVAHQIVGSALLFRAARYRCRPKWRKQRVMTILRFGTSYSAAQWIWQAKMLINPLLVARFAGAEAVAFVALAIRAATVLNLVQAITWRLSVSTLRHLVADRRRLSRVITQAMELQVFSLGSVFAVTGLVLPLALVRLYGDTWLPVATVFPFVALAGLVNALFALHSSALFAVQKNGAVAVFHVFHLFLFIVASLALVPRFGIVGYGLAELVAMLSYPVIHYYYVREFSPPDYQLALVWCVAFGIAPFWYHLGPLSWTGAALVLLWPRTRSVLRGYVSTLMVSWPRLKAA